MRAGQPRGGADPGPRRVRAARQYGEGTTGYGQRPWPGIAAPWCDFCSWAYRGVWPQGRMEVKYLNGMCTVRAHTAPSGTASP